MRDPREIDDEIALKLQTIEGRLARKRARMLGRNLLLRRGYFSTRRKWAAKRALHATRLRRLRRLLG